jgi:hypothetical protein
MFQWNGNLLTNMSRRIFVVMVLFMFLIGSVQASAIASIALDGAMSFLDPTIQAIIQGAMCVAGPAGALTCAVQYVQGKIIGVVSGEIMEQVARLSPEAYKAITTYNKIKSYIDRGASILQELKVGEEGEITGGKISFGEDEYSIKELFPESEESEVEDVIVSNADYDFANRKLEVKEGGFLKIKVRDDEGKIQELTYENIKEGYLKLDEKGVVEEAEIVSGGSTYKFGNYKQIKVPADTQIEYKGGIVRVSKASRSSLYLKYGDISISSLGENPIELSDKQIRCLDCVVGNIKLKGYEDRKGVLEIFDEGFLVLYGEANYKQNFLRVNTQAKKVLITNFGVDLSGYDGSWIRQNSNLLEIHSAEGGMIDLEIAEDHEILNTDSEDKLGIVTQDGDGLKIQKREDEGLIPKVNYLTLGEGKTWIANDKMDVYLKGGDYGIAPPTPLTDNELAGKEKYQSVAMEIELGSSEQKLRISSYNQLVMLSGDNDELVSYNKYDLPVSALIEDNKLQTVAQLRGKYPSLRFRVPEKWISEGKEVENKLSEENVPPYMVYFIDEFFRRNPEAMGDLSEIDFGYDNTGARGIDFVLGVQELDPVELKDFLTREMTSPLQSLDHEYDHVENFWSMLKEFKAVYDDPENKFPSLQQAYNKIALEGIDNLVKNKEFEDSVAELFEDIEKDYIKAGVEEIMQEKYGGDIIGFIKQNIEPEKTKDTILKEYKKDSSLYNLEILDYLLKKGKDSFDAEEQKKLAFLTGVSSLEGQFFLIKDSSEKDLVEYTKFLDDIDVYLDYIPELNKYSNSFRSTIRIYSGLPYAYSLHNYNEEYGVDSGYFLEVSSTYAEQPILERKKLVNSGNKLISDTYKKLTQIAFDSGKMDKEEFLTIMGKGYCKKKDCSDKLCVEYKLLCCVEYPSSPNC